MKITINLTDEEVKGIKAYLKEVDGLKRPSKRDITIFIDGMVQAINSPKEAVSDYILRESFK